MYVKDFAVLMFGHHQNPSSGVCNGSIGEVANPRVAAAEICPEISDGWCDLYVIFFD